MIHGKIPRHVLPYTFRILPEHVGQVFLEIPHEEFPAVAGQNTQSITPIIFQMIEQVGDLYCRPVPDDHRRLAFFSG
jgi:hypothetical protein